MRRIAPRLFIAAFFLATLLPAIQMLTHWSPNFEVDEQRRLAPAPSEGGAAKWAHDANTWFSDHFGYRSLLIRLKAEVDYRVFGVSDKVHVGRDGYLFYRQTLDLEKPAMQRYLSAHEQAAIQGITRYSEALHEQGIGMVMVVNLLGDRFMLDKLPRTLANRPTLPGIDTFTDQLKSIPNLTFIDSTAIVRETTKSRPTFHRTDFHWNDPAAFPVAKAMVDVMSRAEGRPQSVWTHPMHIGTETLSGGVARFMPLLHPPSELALNVKADWSWPAGFTSVAGSPPYESFSRTAPDAQGLLGPVLFVGDSYFDGMLRSGVQAYFKETHRIRWSNGLGLETITAAIPPDTRWVMIQFIEVSQTAVAAFAGPGAVSRAIQILHARRPLR